ncbi:MAG TPA: type IV toxin-antitoxin system AbiEi family antitoxin [Clostridia bacterium]|nr:type IV toxin-antitoxin system AbiEi family antitoxin [Clostridia bacterium]
MKIYKQMAKRKTFALRDVTAITGNESTSTSLISSWLKKKYAVRIRKNLYTCIDLTTGDVIANKYQIASAINEKSYVSHHTAFEFYGMANQVYNTVYVSSENRFNSFEFMGVTYKWIKSAFAEGVIQVKNIEGIKVTDKERTLADSINLASKVGGFEELINIIKIIEDLDSDKLLDYMARYDKKFIYQKAGYLLENYFMGEALGTGFFDECCNKSAGSVRYLIRERAGKYETKWNLVVPEEYAKGSDDMGVWDEYI